MESSHPDFLYQIKYDKFVGYYFFLILDLFNFLIITVIAVLLKFSFEKVYIVILILSFFLSAEESGYYIFKGNKYYDYQKEFLKSKKYSQPFVTILSFALIVILSVIFLNENM